MKVGETYERYAVEGSMWVHDQRTITSFGKSFVSYRSVYPISDGTTTQEFDPDGIQTVDIRGWTAWAKLARIMA